MATMAVSPYERLDVYRASVEFARFAHDVATVWEPSLAVKDHLLRASESIVMNLAIGADGDTPRHVVHLDYALGSALECAACLDIAGAKGLLAGTDIQASGKFQLWRVANMLVGLRRTRRNQVREGDEEDGYSWEPGQKHGGRPPFFAHERLDVYQVAIQFVTWLTQHPPTHAGASRDAHKIDVLATGMVLNIVEGNGRFSVKDQARFLQTAHDATIRVSAYLDLVSARRGWPAGDPLAGKQLLRRVKTMLVGLLAHCRGEGY